MLKRLMTASAVALVAQLAPAAAQQDYAGETIQVIINLSAGGSTGVMAQNFANHWKDHIPGNPDFVVQPVTGGGQMKGIIEARNARPDGLTVAWVAWSGPTRAIGPASQNVDWSDFDVIAGMGVPTMAYGRKDIGGGIESAADLDEAGGVHVGGYRPGSYLDLTARMSLDLLGIEHGYTTGFRGGSNIVAALQRDEVNFHVTPAANYFGGIEANVVDEGTGLPLWYYPLKDAEGNTVAAESFEGIPAFDEVAQQITGEAPSGPLWNAIQWLNEGMAGVTWFIGVPAGTAPETLELLRSSFEETLNDPAFRAEAQKVSGMAPTYTPAGEMEALIDSLKQVDPEIAQTVTDYIASGTQ